MEWIQPIIIIEKIISIIPIINYVELNYLSKQALIIVPKPGGKIFKITHKIAIQWSYIYTTSCQAAHFLVASKASDAFELTCIIYNIVKIKLISNN